MPANHKQLKNVRTWWHKAKVDCWLLPVAITVTICAGLMLMLIGFGHAPVEGQLAPLGTILHADFADITVRSVTYTTPLTPGLELPDGMQVATLDVEIDNHSDRTLEFSPSIQTFMRDDQGGYWQITPAALTYPFPAGAVAPGAKVRGELAYLVPKHTSGLNWYLDHLAPKSAPVVFVVVPQQP